MCRVFLLLMWSTAVVPSATLWVLHGDGTAPWNHEIWFIFKWKFVEMANSAIQTGSHAPQRINTHSRGMKTPESSVGVFNLNQMCYFYIHSWQWDPISIVLPTNINTESKEKCELRIQINTSCYAHVGWVWRRARDPNLCAFHPAQTSVRSVIPLLAGLNQFN